MSCLRAYAGERALSSTVDIGPSSFHLFNAWVCCRTRGDHRIPVEAELVFVEAQRILFLIDDENRAHWVCIRYIISTCDQKRMCILFLIDDENRAHWVCISKSIST